MEMMKALVAVAVSGAFAGAACAQTSVTTYGMVDLGIVQENGAVANKANAAAKISPGANITKLTSGAQSGSRLGFRGIEDLGHGVSALFVMEMGIAADTGGLTQGGLMWGRQIYVGVKSGLGTVMLGRQYSPAHSTKTGVADPFTGDLAGNSGNLMASVTRMDNTIKYVSPRLGGVTAEAAYGLGEVAGNNEAGRVIGAALTYENGPLKVRLGHHDRNNATATDADKFTILAANYNFGPATGFLAYGKSKGYSFGNNYDALIGIRVPVGASVFVASYIHNNDKLSVNRDASQFALGYMYYLSKRTNLYVSAGVIDNKNGAVYTVGNGTEGGTGNKAYNAGIRHTF